MVRTASLVTFAMYFVFFVSSPSAFLEAVVAATTADAELTDDVLIVADFWVVAGWVFDFDFESVTVVQSWQSGTSGSGVLYLFLVEDILDTGDGVMELRDIIYHHMGLYQFVTIDYDRLRSIIDRLSI
jgi:hypothetical protein